MGIYKVKPLRGGIVSPNGQAIKRETTLKLTPAQAEKLLYAGAEIYQLVGDKKFRLNKDNCTTDFEKLQVHIDLTTENTKKEKITKEPQIIINSSVQTEKQKKSVALDNNTVPAVNIPSIPVEEENGMHDNDSNATNTSKYISYNSSSSKHRPNNNAQKKRYN